MRGTRSTTPRRSPRAALAAALLALTAFVAATSPAAATPAVATAVRDITATSATVCATGIRPAVVTQFGVYDGDDTKLVASTKFCNTVTGLRGGQTYVLVFKSGRPGDEASMRPEGEVTFTTLPPTTSGAAVARDLTATSVRICKTYVNVASERSVVFEEYGVGTSRRTKVAESSAQCTLVDSLSPGREYTFSLWAANLGAADSALWQVGTVTVVTPTFEGPAPTAFVRQVGRRSGVVCGVPKPGDAPKRWIVFRGDVKLNESTDECVLVSGLQPQQPYALTLMSGPIGGPDTGLTIEGDARIVTRQASRAEARQVTATSALLCLNFFEVPAETAYFSAYDGDREVGRVQAANSCVPVSGLEPSTTYTLTLKSSFVGRTDQFDWGEATFTTLAETPTPTPTATSTPSPTATATPTATASPSPTPTPTATPTPAPTATPGPPTCEPPSGGGDTLFIDYVYSLAGSASLKTLTKGSLPLTGKLRCGRVGLPSGAFSGVVTFDPATGNLTALGFLPIVAKVHLVPTERATGSFKSGVFSLSVKARIKLPSVRALGVELAGGANCQAKQISAISLVSTQPPFLPLSGGPMAGTFSIGNLTGCGFLTGLVSPLTQGSGNAIALNLAPAS